MSENPLGFHTLDIEKFKATFLSPDFSIDSIRDLALKGDCVSMGSRTFSWRLFLGVIPDENSPAKWVQAIRSERNSFYSKTEELKLVKNKELDPKFFNPLAAATQSNPWNEFFKDKDVRELIF